MRSAAERSAGLGAERSHGQEAVRWDWKERLSAVAVARTGHGAFIVKASERLVGDGEAGGGSTMSDVCILRAVM